MMSQTLCGKVGSFMNHVNSKTRQQSEQTNLKNVVPNKDTSLKNKFLLENYISEQNVLYFHR